jgi:hypothetical protein
MIAIGILPRMPAQFALALPVLHALLALDLVLLAATAAVALRLLARVRIAPKNETPSDAEGSDAGPEPQTRPSFTLIPPQRRQRMPASEQPPLPLSGAVEQTGLQSESLPNAQPEAPASAVQFLEDTALGGIVSDPIDGVPFHAGETILLCRCGAGYHQETAAWLREHLAGKCVHCGAEHALVPRLLEPRA